MLETSARVAIKVLSLSGRRMRNTAICDQASPPDEMRLLGLMCLSDERIPILIPDFNSQVLILFKYL